jgi:uncharacterized FlgJ-related protein
MYENSVLIGNTIYLRASRMTSEIAAEEMLHTFVYNMKHESGNPELFDKLFTKAKEQFPKLWQEIQHTYQEDQQSEELVTQVLARYFNNKFDEKDKLSIKDLIDKFKEWIISLFKELPWFNEYLQKYEITIDNINPLSTFEDIADILLAKDAYVLIKTIPDLYRRNAIQD